MRIKPNRFKQRMLCGEHVGKTAVLSKTKIHKWKYTDICLNCSKEKCTGSCELIGGK